MLAASKYSENSGDDGGSKIGTPLVDCPDGETKMPKVMQIQINTDKTITMDISLARFVKAEITRALGRFESQLTRVEVHLSDVNSHKPGPYDKRCQIEARPAGRKPVSVSIEAETVAEAVEGAANKMKRLLMSAFGRTRSRRASSVRKAA